MAAIRASEDEGLWGGGLGLSGTSPASYRGQLLSA